ncbi:hypothetical protein AAEX28_01040 [Lentisphaerota bacterium WC36G]|nr:hypothetical protein LJT99_03920 [Lentisphaerae bacterium WC36]
MLEGAIIELINDKSLMTTIYLNRRIEKCPVISGRSMLFEEIGSLGNSLDSYTGKVLSFEANISKNSFMSFAMFPITISIEILEQKFQNLSIIVKENHLDYLRAYNQRILYNCHNHFYAASTELHGINLI